MTEPLRFLLVEDSPTDAKLLMHALRRERPDTEIERVEDEASMRRALATQKWDGVVSDWSLPTFGALEALSVLQSTGLDLPFIIVSGTIGEEAAVEAMRAGAHDYVLKGNLTRLSAAIDREIRECKLREVHRTQEMRFKALIEKSAEGIFLSDADRLITYASPAAEKILGRTGNEILGRRISEFIHEADLPLIDATAREVRSCPGAQRFIEFRIRRPSGEIRWAECVSKNHLADPIVAGIVTNLRDVTERKKAAEALRVSEERFTRLAESGIVGIITADFEGRILDANPSYLKSSGYTMEDFTTGGIRWADLIPRDLHESTARVTQALLTTGVAPVFESAVIAKDGRRIPLLVGAAMIDETRCVAFSIDLTEQRRAEAALRTTEEHLRQAQKMEAVGRLAGGVAHDFNNVLSVILTYGDLLYADLPPDDPMREDVDEIRKAGKRAATLTRQLLMFSRQQVLEPRVLDLNEILAGLDKMLPRLIGEDIEIVSRREPALATTRVDPSSMEQVIMNIVVNARDAMPTGGTLTIETDNVSVDEALAAKIQAKKTGPHVVITVSDTGTGMDDATMSHIFEPFFTTNAKEKGTGLGLSTVFGIVEQSEGAIAVESAVGKGTTFRLYVPAEGVAREPAKTTTSTRALKGSETILLIEDEEQVRAVARGILKRNGYQVIEARGPDDAAKICRGHDGPIHLLLTDVAMPVISGPDLAARLKPIRPEMKVLFMSGYTSDDTVRRSALQADIEFLQKPLTPDSLARKVRDVLDRIAAT